MEDNNRERDNEVVKMPTNHDEAHEMLSQVESLLDNFSIVSAGMPSSGMFGSVDQGFGFN